MFPLVCCAGYGSVQLYRRVLIILGVDWCFDDSAAAPALAITTIVAAVYLIRCKLADYCSRGGFHCAVVRREEWVFEKSSKWVVDKRLVSLSTLGLGFELNFTLRAKPKVAFTMTCSVSEVSLGLALCRLALGIHLHLRLALDRRSNSLVGGV